MKEFWNTRYNDNEYVYGKQPNQFFREMVDQLQLSGSILMAAEGEGRNAVYAAKKGLNVHAFDISHEGKKKAERLAVEESVTIHYEVGDLFDLSLISGRYDAAALIYAHFPPYLLPVYHKKISQLVKPEGILILEGFSKKHIEKQLEYPNVGGPKNVEMLFTLNQVEKDFSQFHPIISEEKDVELSEGNGHIGTGSVIRFVGRKKM